MNTEQLKTAEEILNHHYVHDNMMTQQKGWIINAMNSFASQESKRAVDEFKEKLKELIRNEMKPEIVGGHRFHREPDFLFGCEKCIDLIDKL